MRLLLFEVDYGLVWGWLLVRSGRDLAGLERRHLEFGVHDESFEELATCKHQMLRHEVLIVEESLVCSTETSLHREYVGDLELSPEGHARCCLLRLVHAEARVLEGEEIKELAHDEGEDTSRMWSLVEVIAVHEDVLSSRMTMQVTD